MEGLYKGKYLIGIYDEEDFPVFIASSIKEFFDVYIRLFKRINPSSTYKALKRLMPSKRECRLNNTKCKLVLIEADTITHDCFEDADKDFIEFISETHYKTIHEICEEMGISDRTYYRWKKKGKIKASKEGGVIYEQANLRRPKNNCG